MYSPDMQVVTVVSQPFEQNCYLVHLHDRTDCAVIDPGLEPEKIIEVAKTVPVVCEAAAPVETALARALELAAETGDVIVSAGSMFVTAEVVNGWRQRMAVQSG